MKTITDFSHKVLKVVKYGVERETVLEGCGHKGLQKLNHQIKTRSKT